MSSSGTAPSPPPTRRTPAGAGRVLIGVGLSLGLLAAAFWRADFGRLAGHLRQAEVNWLAAAFVVNLLGLGLRAWRWRLLVPGPDAGRFSDYLDSVNIGYFLNNVAPARLGDVVRSALLGRWTQIGAGRALSTTILERVLDSAILLALTFALLALLPLPSVVNQVGLALLAVVAVALLGMGWLASNRQRGGRWLARLLGLVPGIDSEAWSARAMRAAQGFEPVRQPRLLVAFGLASLLVWGQTILAFWLTLRAFGPEATWILAAWATVAAGLGLAIPSAPAGLGTFEAAVVGALVFAGTADDLARSQAIALHGLPFLALTSAGLWSLMRRGLGLRGLRSLARQPTPS